jgi:dienelactone hydrolase
LKVPLWNEEFDSPDEPNNYGIMGWIQDDVAVLVYDKYDIWAVDPTGENTPQIFSQGLGRKAKKTFRYVQLDPEKRFFKFDDGVLMRSFDHETKKSGLAMMGMDPKRFWIVRNSEGNFQIGPVQGQKGDPDKLIYTKENFNSSPDLYSVLFTSEESSGGDTAPSLTVRELKLSAINPQQTNYLWGSAELFKWKAYNGKEATGIVYKPENFDPKKKYPMIVYFYEKLSQDLFDYKEPAPIRSAVNVPFFVSRGYVIFMPDIVYTTGQPGKNAYDYIVSGSRALAKQGWVDSTKMALQGHSWGGYQAAQVATMTKLFKAVWAGAPVANMTSAYGGIRWESGVSRQFQYERTQSRIGGTIWEKLPLYLENSPLFHLDKVTAPMVIMHNDADGAVPWYQGIELFTGLRRLGKKVWMFNYNGQGHGLTQRQDMRDYQIRMQQFFDWILKGEKPARWITDGVPAVNKGKDWGLDRE